MSRKPANERASERVRIGAPATLKWGEQETTGFVEVVNIAGMYVATSRSPEIGDYVELVFSLPGDRRSFRVRGNVVFLEAAPDAVDPPCVRRALRAPARHPARRDQEPEPGTLGRRERPSTGQRPRLRPSYSVAACVCLSVEYMNSTVAVTSLICPAPTDEIVAGWTFVSSHRARMVCCWSRATTATALAMGVPVSVALLSQSWSRLSPFWVTVSDETPLVGGIRGVEPPRVGARHGIVVELDPIPDDPGGQDAVDEDLKAVLPGVGARLREERGGGEQGDSSEKGARARLDTEHFSSVCRKRNITPRASASRAPARDDRRSGT